jgi:hypothetical protein
MLPAGAGETSSALTIISLCPECRSALTPRIYTCPQCHLEFKNEKTAVRRTWLIPGGDYFYTRRPWYGLAIALWESLWTLVMLVAFLCAWAETHAQPAAGEPPADATSTYFVPVFLLVILVFTKWMKARMVRKQVQDFIPMS